MALSPEACASFIFFEKVLSVRCGSWQRNLTVMPAAFSWPVLLWLMQEIAAVVDALTRIRGVPFPTVTTTVDALLHEVATRLTGDEFAPAWVHALAAACSRIIVRMMFDDCRIHRSNSKMVMPVIMVVVLLQFTMLLLLILTCAFVCCSLRGPCHSRLHQRLEIHMRAFGFCCFCLEISCSGAVH